MIPDQSRQDATRPDSDFSISIDEALERYTRAGHPRTPRTIQRYCAKGHLECRLVETGSGDKWLITPDSVDKHIAYIEEVTPAISRDTSRQVGSIETTSIEPSRLVAPGPDMSRYVARVEIENDFLRKQITVKDEQIKDLTERARETNHLIAGLQQILRPLIGGGTEPENRG